MDVLDTLAQLAELRARVDHILDRIAANSRLAAAALGTLDPTALSSGCTRAWLILTTQPHPGGEPNLRPARHRQECHRWCPSWAI
ncbi:hypothetical protein ACI2L1_28655 [Streptomyces sp. NPDC019531]|uniref:hypothetical protein n=1 Tax=Streptomyces sp. NPDC019531 TaxID=3365062 RepID=UPI00384A89BC